MNQRILYIDVGSEHSAAERASRIDSISRRRVDLFHVMLRARNGDAGRIGVDFHDLLSGGKISDNSRVNLDVSSHASIKRKMQLAGHDLNYLDVAGMADLHRSQFKSAFTGLRVCQFDFRMNLVRL